VKRPKRAPLLTLEALEVWLDTVQPPPHCGLSMMNGFLTGLAAGPVFPNALTSIPTGGSVSASNIQMLAPNLKTPYSEQGNIGIQRQLASDISMNVSYIWSRGVQLYGVRDLNLPTATTNFTYTINNASGSPTGTYTVPVITGKRPDTRYGTIAYAENGVNSYYNGLAVQANRRFAHGLQAMLSYTWSHEIDDGQGAGSNALYYNSFNSVYNGNYTFEKGTGLLDQRQRLVYSFVWQPTFTHRTDAFSRYVLNNWQFAGITTIASGRPVGSASVRLTDTPVTGMLSSSVLDGFSGGSSRVPFLPVNGIETPAAYRADLRLTKVLPISENLRVALAVEAFNISNSWSPTSMSTQYYTEKNSILTPSPTGTASTWGIGTADGGFPDGTQARRLQVSARITF